MQADIDRVLLPQHQIAQRVRELGHSIAQDHLAHDSQGAITLVPILTGSMIFCADLMRQINLPLRIGLLTVSSYPGTSIRSQGSSVVAKQLGDLRGRHVLLVDDILDSGGTLNLVLPLLKSMEPLSVRTCVLLRKHGRPAARNIPVEYVGFDIPDEFVVGYGLDYNDYYRNLPDIVTLKKSVIAESPHAGVEPQTKSHL